MGPLHVCLYVCGADIKCLSLDATFMHLFLASVCSVFKGASFAYILFRRDWSIIARNIACFFSFTGITPLCWIVSFCLCTYMFMTNNKTKKNADLHRI